MNSKLRLRPPKITLWLQWTGCLAAFLSTFVNGLMLGWSSPYLAKLTGEGSTLNVTTSEASWVASISNWGRIVGAFLSATSIDRFGSKRTMFLASFPMLLSWSCTILADSVIWLYFAKLVHGLGHGVVTSCLPVYLGEITDPSIRGASVSLAFGGYELGTLLGNVMGAYLSMSLFGWISLVPTVAGILIFVRMPESPHYLIRAGKMEEAQISIGRYNPGSNVETEFKALEAFVSTTGESKFADRLREFCLPRNRKCGLILCALYIFMQASGVNSFIFYEEIIMTRGGFAEIAPAVAVMILTLVSIVAGFVAAFLADRCGRRMLWNVGCGGTLLSMMMLGAHFTLLDKDFDPATLQWLLVAALTLWQIFTFVGPNPVPTVILSELFAPNIKSLAACLASVCASVFAFLSCKSYQPIVDAVGDAYVFWIHGSLMAAAVVFGVLVLPETKGKSLQEIQDSMAK